MLSLKRSEKNLVAMLYRKLETERLRHIWGDEAVQELLLSLQGQQGIVGGS